jgi:surface antigen
MEVSLGGDHIIRSIFSVALIRKTLTTISLVAVLVTFTGTAIADSLDSQIAAAQAAAAAQASQYQGQANTYQDQVSKYQAQVNAIQAQINLSQAQYDQITNQIAANEAQLAIDKSNLGADIKQMYLDSGVTPLEMLASSQNISDFMNKQQYQDTVQQKIVSTMASVVALQKQLADQKQQVSIILESQQSQRTQVATLEQQANGLLATAQSSASAANQQVQSNNSQVAKLKAQQAAILQASSNSYNGSIPGASDGSGGACDNSHGNGGYPMSWCNIDKDSYQTPWGQNRECVSWAGWRRKQINRPVPNMGYANTWGTYAPQYGYRVDSTPQVGAVAWTQAGRYGHVAVVEVISGGNVIVSEMNYDGMGHFRYGTYSASYFQYIH